MKRVVMLVAMVAILTGCGTLGGIGQRVDLAAVAKELQVELTDTQVALLNEIALDGKVSNAERDALNAIRPGLGTVAQRLLGTSEAAKTSTVAQAEAGATGATVRVVAVGEDSFTVTLTDTRRYVVRVVDGKAVMEPVP